MEAVLSELSKPIWWVTVVIVGIIIKEKGSCLCLTLLAQKRGLLLENIGQEFMLLKYSSVSSIVTRTEKQLKTNSQLQNRIEEIILTLVKSQAKI